MIETSARWWGETNVGPRLSFLLASIVCLSASLLSATSIIPVSDVQLYSRADVVVHGIVWSNQTQLDGYGRVETVTTVRPIEVVKGSLGDDLVLHQVGGRLPDGRFVQIWGRPEYAPGSEVVVFAIARAEGDYQTAELLLGKFEVQHDEQFALFAVPDLAIGSHPGVTLHQPILRTPGMDDGSDPAEEREESFSDPGPRELTSFLAYLRSGAAGAYASVAVEGKLTPIEHPDAPPLEAVPESANSSSGLWRYNNGATAVWTLQGTANITGGGTAESQGAVSAWTNHPNSTINYTIGAGSSNVMQLNALSSPCGWSTCLTGGGVIGCGGPSGGGSNTWRGDTYTTITGGTVWLRSYCSFNGFDSITTQSVLTHELGHTLGLGHSDQNVSPHDVCRGDEGAAIMYSTVQHRTTLGTDDQDAIRWIYGDGGNSCTSGPAVTSISPAQGAAGDTVPVTIRGTNFQSGATVSVGTGITASNTAVLSATQLTATLAVAAGVVVELFEVPGTEVGQFVLFPVTPEEPDGVELRNVPGQVFDLDQGVFGGKELGHQVTSVRGRAIPDDEQLSADVSHQVLQEEDDLRTFDRAGEEPEVEVPKASPPRLPRGSSSGSGTAGQEFFLSVPRSGRGAALAQ